MIQLRSDEFLTRDECGAGFGWSAIQYRQYWKREFLLLWPLNHDTPLTSCKILLTFNVNKNKKSYFIVKQSKDRSLNDGLAQIVSNDNGISLWWKYLVRVRSCTNRKLGVERNFSELVVETSNSFQLGICEQGASITRFCPWRSAESMRQIPSS